MSLITVQKSLDDATLSGGAEIKAAGGGLPRRITTYARQPSFLDEDVGVGSGDRGWTYLQWALPLAWDHDGGRLLVGGNGPYGAAYRAGRYDPSTSTWDTSEVLPGVVTGLAALSTGKAVVAPGSGGALYVLNEDTFATEAVIDLTQWNAAATVPKWLVALSDDTVIIGFSSQAFYLHVNPATGTLVQELTSVAAGGHGQSAAIVDDRWLVTHQGLQYAPPKVYDLDNVVGGVPDQPHTLWGAGNDAGVPFEGAGGWALEADPDTGTVWCSYQAYEESKPLRMATVDAATGAAVFAEVMGSTAGFGGAFAFAKPHNNEQWFAWFEGTGVDANGTPRFNCHIRKKNVQRARWVLDVTQEAYPQGLTVKGATFPGILPEWQVPFRSGGTVDTDPFRASRLYWSKNGGARTEFAQGEVLNIALSAGDTFEFDADLLDWLPSSTAPYVAGPAGEGPVLLADDPSATVFAALPVVGISGGARVIGGGGGVAVILD